MAYTVSDYIPINYGWELSKCDNYLQIGLKAMKFS